MYWYFARISEKQLIEKNAEKNLEGAINSNFNKESAKENQTEETDKTIKISKS